ncbi:filamin-binding LIM protein 1 isoform X4 [Rhineura floridana]|uniref:filamin-binding LIM protein 1 isoform X4 n=1 Tax=Rhineura floridana TaxID=261503 RepID=UPI002AC7F70C|nr:filamin-binding LIM protein 1 isoform X4 [Rhineura floridana]
MYASLYSQDAVAQSRRIRIGLWKSLELALLGASCCNAPCSVRSCPAEKQPFFSFLASEDFLRRKVKMLSDKVEKRIASSIFITLTPPRRDHMVRSETTPQKAPFLHSNNLPKEDLTSAALSPPQTSSGPITGSRGHCSGTTNIPNGGCSASVPPSILPCNPTHPELDSFLPPPPPPPPYSHHFSVETLGPDLQKRTAVLSSQTSSTFPAELRQPKILPSTLSWADEHQRERKMENAVSKDICAFCHKTISPWAPTLEAMNKQYHADCFTCRTCHGALAGQRYYQKEGRPLCVTCYQNTLEKCGKCHALILNQIVRAMGHGFHPECFICVVCGRAIGDETFAVGDDEAVHCLEDFYRRFASVCGACERPIIPSDGKDSYKIECMGQNFHEDCYRCERCQVLLSPEPTEDGCYPLGSRLLCKSCHIRHTKESSC